MSVKELRRIIESAVIEFSKENEIEHMDVHVSTIKKVKCDITGTIKSSWLEAETKIKIK